MGLRKEYEKNELSLVVAGSQDQFSGIRMFKKRFCSGRCFKRLFKESDVQKGLLAIGIGSTYGYLSLNGIMNNDQSKELANYQWVKICGTYAFNIAAISLVCWGVVKILKAYCMIQPAGQECELQPLLN